MCLSGSSCSRIYSHTLPGTFAVGGVGRSLPQHLRADAFGITHLIEAPGLENLGKKALRVPVFFRYWASRSQRTPELRRLDRQDGLPAHTGRLFLCNPCLFLPIFQSFSPAVSSGTPIQQAKSVARKASWACRTRRPSGDAAKARHQRINVPQLGGESGTRVRSPAFPRSAPPGRSAGTGATGGRWPDLPPAFG